MGTAGWEAFLLFFYEGLLEARAYHLWGGWGYQPWFEAPSRYTMPSFDALFRLKHFMRPELNHYWV
jgi:hypothetical protein